MVGRAVMAVEQYSSKTLTKKKKDIEALKRGKDTKRHVRFGF